MQKDRPLVRRQLRGGKQQSITDIIFSLPTPPQKKKTNHTDQELQWNTSQRHKQGNSCSKKPLEQLPRTAVPETSVHLKNRLSAARKGTTGRVKSSSGTNTTGKSHSSSPHTLSLQYNIKADCYYSSRDLQANNLLLPQGLDTTYILPV